MKKKKFLKVVWFLVLNLTQIVEFIQMLVTVYENENNSLSDRNIMKSTKGYQFFEMIKSRTDI